MKIPSKLIAIPFAALILTTFSAFAAVDPAASVILLRTSCNDGAGGTLNNCFTKTGLVRNYIYAQRADKTAKLLIDIGPGTFDTFFPSPDCQTVGGGTLTFRGAGVETTVLASVVHLGCVNSKWAFEDMTIRNTAMANTVVWNGGGESTWTNVVIGPGGVSESTWYDAADTDNTPCAPGLQGIHRFFSSRIIGSKSTAFRSACGDNWFWGSEIVLITFPNSTNVSAIRSTGVGNRIHLYGSNVRVEASPSATSLTSITAITVSNGAELHAHGVGIDAIGKAGTSVTALDASSDGKIHANASSYFLRTGAGGTVTRINNHGETGHVHAPYLWEHIPDTDGNPSTVDTNFVSINGVDQTTVRTGTLDGHPHPAIYSTSCGSTARWYDTVDKVCRSK